MLPANISINKIYFFLAHPRPQKTMIILKETKGWKQQQQQQKKQKKKQKKTNPDGHSIAQDNSVCWRC